MCDHRIYRAMAAAATLYLKRSDGSLLRRA